MIEMNLAPILTSSPPAVSRETWRLAIEAFLDSKGTRSPETRRSYAWAIRDFFAIAEKEPDAVTVVDVIAYRRLLEARGNSPSTVAGRLAALSSLYRYLSRPMDARGRCLVQSNPFAAVERPDVEAGARSKKMRLEDFAAILRHLSVRLDPLSRRDLALVLCYVYTGRRRREIVNLRAGDLTVDDAGRMFYRYVGKRRKRGFRELAPPAAAALRLYLRVTGRDLETMPEDAPLFVSHRGRRIGQALRPDAVLRMLKARAVTVGIPPSRVQAHGLRHLAAELRRRSGASIETVSSFLDHSSLAVTSLYLARHEGRTDDGWEGVAGLLDAAGIPESVQP